MIERVTFAECFQVGEFHRVAVSAGTDCLRCHCVTHCLRSRTLRALSPMSSRLSRMSLCHSLSPLSHAATACCHTLRALATPVCRCPFHQQVALGSVSHYSMHACVCRGRTYAMLPYRLAAVASEASPSFVIADGQPQTSFQTTYYTCGAA